MNSMQRWLRNYDRVRAIGGLALRNVDEGGSFHSTKFPLEAMSWNEIREIPIPSLGPEMTFGKSCEALRKSWYHYKMLKRQGTYAGDIAFRINKIQRSMGIPLTEFDDVDPEWVAEELASESEQLTPEEIELRREEMLEENGEGGDKEDDWEDL